MNIKLNTLTIKNFKGIKSREISFDEKQTNIYGTNAAGKTTIFDAFCWLLFNKDSNDTPNFEPKPLAADGTTTGEIETEVRATLNIDGNETTIVHTQREKWVKKHGEQERTFEGNEHKYLWNDTPLKPTEYKTKINDLIPEKIFKLLTSPRHFNDNITWKDRRDFLVKMAGGTISDAEIAATQPQFADLVKELTKKTFQEHRNTIAAQIKKIKDEEDGIQPRIDQEHQSQPQRVDEAAVQTGITQLDGQIEAIDKQIEDANEAYNKAHQANLSTKQLISQLELANQNIRHQVSQELSAGRNQLQSDLFKAKSAVSQATQQKANYQKAEEDAITFSKQLEQQLNAMREDWTKKNDETFQYNEGDLNCPTCQQPVEGKEETLRENFEANKTKELALITERAGQIKTQLTNQEALIKQYNDKFLAVAKKLAEAETEVHRIEARLNNTKETKTEAEALAEHAEYQNNLSKIKTLAATIEATIQPADTQALKEQKANLQDQRDGLIKKLAQAEQIEKSNKEIERLKALANNLAQQKADLQKQQYLAEEFNKLKIQEVEKRVNDKFQYAKFKMFRQLINRGEEEICETTYNGVPWALINDGHKIWTGIDIINTLHQHYNITAPMFIDNRESVIQIPPTNAQIINLIVSAADKTLRIE